MEKDYYDILGVSRDASQQEIKAAYHTLAHHLHSDKDEGSEKKFLKIVEAYSVLSDDKKRGEYNQNLVATRTSDSEKEKDSSDDKNNTIEGEKERSPAVVFVLVGAMLLVVIIAVTLISSSSQSSSTSASSTVSATGVSSTVVATVKNSAANPPQAPPVNPSANLSPSVIAQIEPNVVEINCYSADNSWESSGSGISYLNGGNNDIETNYHVYSGAVVNGEAPTCYAVFPEPPNFSYNAYYGDYQLNLNAWHYNPNTYEDAAIFTLGTPLSTSVALNPIPVDNNRDCSASDNINVGDALTIFGYPASGNALGISETVTEGIVSGILPGPIYKTNAAIDHGNSGGIAILNENDCAIGIPTLGVSGLTSGIGYIQSYSLAKQPINTN